MEQNTPEAWYRSLPPITRAILTITFFVTLAQVLGLFNPAILVLEWRLVWFRMQLWRLFTDYFYVGPFSFGWLIHVYFLVTFSSKLEQNEIFSSNTPGSFLYFLLLQIISLDLTSLLLFWPSGKMVMAPSLSFAIIYYWSRREPWAQVGLWGFAVHAYQFPFALMLLNILMGNSLWGDLMGLFTGHLFYFLRELLPVEHNIDILSRTPAFLDDLMLKAKNFQLSSLQYSSGGTGSNASSSAASVRNPAAANVRERRTVEFSGTGYRLGGD